ncbi:MAG TPA: hypothetical protein VLZ72_05750 [Flavobacterium sp.]|nr:hypothetical protein [Flavobacterium sp.]
MNIDGKIFKGLIFNDFVIYKKQIKTDKIKCFNVYKNHHQTSAPWWTGPLMDSFIKEHLYELRTESISGKEKYIIRFNEQKFFEFGIDFLKRNTDFEIKNCG